MDGTQPDDNAENRFTQQICDREASVHFDLSASGIVADGIPTPP